MVKKVLGTASECRSVRKDAQGIISRAEAIGRGIQIPGSKPKSTRLV